MKRVLLIILIGIFSYSSAIFAAEHVDIVVTDGEIHDFSYQVLNLMKVDDDLGVKQILILNPPKFHGDEIRWFNQLRFWLMENKPGGPFDFSVPIYPPRMIRKMRHGDKDSLSCGPSSVAFAGLLLAHDIPVRIVHIYPRSVDHSISSHTFNEVWSEKYQKWIVQDVSHNLFWLDENNIPASTLEIQNEFYNCLDKSECYQIKPVERYDYMFLKNIFSRDYFYRLVVCFRSNYFRCSTGYLQYQIGALAHIPQALLPEQSGIEEMEDDDRNWNAYKKKLGIQRITNVEQIYSPLNQIKIDVLERKTGFLFNLRNNILNFYHYEVRHTSERWEKMEPGKSEFILKKPVKNEICLMFRGVSGRGHITKAWNVKIKPVNEEKYPNK